MDSHPSTDSAERILQAASRLFAERGFNGVSIRVIAAAVGLNVATVHYHAGSKRDLYLKVIGRLYEEERALVEEFEQRAEEHTLQDPQAFGELLTWLADRLVDLLVRDPGRPYLYMRRWLEARDELSQAEAEYALDIFRRARRVFANAQQAGVIRHDLDLGLFLRSFDWLTYGYFVSGPVDWRTWRGDPRDPSSLASFKAYLHDYLDRMLEVEK